MPILHIFFFRYRLELFYWMFLSFAFFFKNGLCLKLIFENITSNFAQESKTTTRNLNVCNYVVISWLNRKYPKETSSSQCPISLYSFLNRFQRIIWQNSNTIWKLLNSPKKSCIRTNFLRPWRSILHLIFKIKRSKNGSSMRKWNLDFST